MNAKVSAKARTKAGEVLKVVGVAAALLVGSSSVFAEPHGGGFGGGHSSGGHFSAPHYASHGPGVAHYAAAPHYSAGGHAYVGGRAYGGYGYGYRGVGGYGYRPWGGGYWRGGFWPAAYYGWSYPFYLGVLPALYATYWWSGVPYYYVNNVYYTWNAADNGYVATDPPPVSGDYTDDVPGGRTRYHRMWRRPRVRPRTSSPTHATGRAISSSRPISSSATTGRRPRPGSTRPASHPRAHPRVPAPGTVGRWRPAWMPAAIRSASTPRTFVD